MRSLKPRTVLYVPLQGQPLHALLGAAYRQDERSAVVRQFIEQARPAAGPVAS